MGPRMGSSSFGNEPSFWKEELKKRLKKGLKEGLKVVFAGLVHVTWFVLTGGTL